MELRPYQKECIEAIVAKAKSGITKQLIVLCTGSGKTHIFSQFPPILRKAGKKTLILTHREELVWQIKKELLLVTSDLKVGIEQRENSLTSDEIKEVDVVIASVPTLGRTGSERIQKFSPDAFSLIVADESHRIIGQSWRNVLEYFDVLKGKVKRPNSRILLGCTATPNRTDKVGLDTVFDEVVFNYGLRQAITEGYLADIKAYSIQTTSDISGVATRAGDFAEGELADAVNNEERNRLIVESFRDIAGDTKALAFVVNIQHAEDLNTMFRKYGYVSEYIVGTTDKIKRKKILEAFKEGHIQILVGVNIFIEGFNVPNIETVLMCRPTKSSIVYSQAIGRGTRKCEGKDYMNFLDFVDNVGRNQLISAPSLFGLNRTIRLNGRRLTEVVDKAEKILEVNPNVELETIDDWSDENIEKIITKVDIFAHAQLPEVVKSNSKYSWNIWGDGYAIQFPVEEETQTKDIVVIQPNVLGVQEVVYKQIRKIPPSASTGYRKWKVEKEEVLGTHAELFNAFKAGDSWITENKPNYGTMFKQDAVWRSDAPTEKQVNLLKKFGVPIPEGISKGECSTLIAKVLNERNNKF